jgi:hypothetical protein
MAPSSPYHAGRYYEESHNPSPRIMQYQHEHQPEYPPRMPFAYSDYLGQDPLSRGQLWAPSNGYAHELTPEEQLFGVGEVMKMNEGVHTHTRGGLAPRDLVYNLYEAHSPNEFLRSSMPPQSQKIYAPLSLGGPLYPPVYAPREMFPQEYYETAPASQTQASHSAHESSPDRHLGRYSATESGLNIEASAFLPANASRPDLLMPFPPMSMTMPPPDFAFRGLDSSGQRHPGGQSGGGSLEVQRVSYAPSTESDRKIELADQANLDSPGPGSLSDLLDRSLSSEPEHLHAAETDPSRGY